MINDSFTGMYNVKEDADIPDYISLSKVFTHILKEAHKECIRCQEAIKNKHVLCDFHMERLAIKFEIFIFSQHKL